MLSQAGPFGANPFPSCSFSSSLPIPSWPHFPSSQGTCFSVPSGEAVHSDSHHCVCLFDTTISCAFSKIRSQAVTAPPHPSLPACIISSGKSVFPTLVPLSMNFFFRCRHGFFYLQPCITSPSWVGAEIFLNKTYKSVTPQALPFP